MQEIGAACSNVVFDLGGVVLTWDPEALVEDLFPAPRVAKRVLRDIVRHPDWIELDRGVLTWRQVAERGAARTGLPIEHIVRLLEAVPGALAPIPGTLDLLRRIEASDCSLYCLSNMHTETIEQLERDHGFWPLFKGRVMSCRVGSVKPEPAIYQHLLDRYGLVAEASVFIDDMQVNLDAAARLGFRTVLFRNPAQCEAELRGLGLLFPGP